MTEDFERSATGTFLRNAKAFVAELEREKIRERTNRGKAARIADGKYPAVGRPPYGYRWRDPGPKQKTQLVPDETTAPIVQRIFRDMAAGASARTVAMALTASGVPTATGRGAWILPTILNMIRHPAYVGDLCRQPLADREGERDAPVSAQTATRGITWSSGRDPPARLPGLGRRRPGATRPQ